MNKPNLKELKINYSNYLVKVRNGDVCFIVNDDDNYHTLFANRHTTTFYNIENGGVSNLDDYDENLKDITNLKEYDIVAIKLCTSEIEPIRVVVNNIKDIRWDWEEDQVEEMTLAEVCKALGKNIKIVKE